MFEQCYPIVSSFFSSCLFRDKHLQSPCNRGKKNNVLTEVGVSQRWPSNFYSTRRGCFVSISRTPEGTRVFRAYANEVRQFYKFLLKRSVEKPGSGRIHWKTETSVRRDLSGTFFLKTRGPCRTPTRWLIQ